MHSTFNDAISCSRHKVSNDWVVVNNEFERIWNEEAVVSFYDTVAEFPWIDRGKPPEACQESERHCRDPNWGPLGQKSEALLLQEMENRALSYPLVPSELVGCSLFQLQP
jgi:hypothetical protein